MATKSRVIEAVEKMKSQIIEISRYLFNNPETAHKEFLAVEYLGEQLKNMGFEVESGVAGLKTAFTAVKRGSHPNGPKVAFIAEYDALPDLGHACGHNIIAASAIGAAKALADVLHDLPGEVWVIGTPSEEGRPQGKAIMVEEGIFDPIDLALIAHGSDRTSTGGRSLAIQSVSITFHGRPAHASKYPWKGISALDAALLSMHAIEMMREHVTPDVRIHGIITDGGEAPNIVPEQATIRYYVRAERGQMVEEVMKRVCHAASKCADAIGASVTAEKSRRIEHKILLPTLDELLLKEVKDVGATGIMEAEDALGSTDFANVSHKVPASTLKIKVAQEGVGVHTREFLNCAGGEEGERAAILAAKAMAAMAFEYLKDSNLRETIKKEHEEFS